jgi:hypothetical protein
MSGRSFSTFGRFCTYAISLPPSSGASCLNASTAPFGPADTFATPSRLHSIFTAVISSSCFVSSGSGPNRSISSAANASRSPSVARSASRRYNANRVERSSTYPSGISTAAPTSICGDQSSATSCVSSVSPDRSAFTASSSICWYSSTPTSRICPDCSSPSRLPPPRISRSWLASMKPAPRLSSDCNTFSRRSAPSVSFSSGRRRQIRIRPQLRPPDASAQLIQLRQAEHVRAVDDQRVRSRNIEPGFHDRGRQQHIRLPS